MAAMKPEYFIIDRRGFVSWERRMMSADKEFKFFYPASPMLEVTKKDKTVREYAEGEDIQLKNAGKKIPAKIGLVGPKTLGENRLEITIPSWYLRPASEQEIRSYGFVLDPETTDSDQGNKTPTEPEAL